MRAHVESVDELSSFRKRSTNESVQDLVLEVIDTWSNGRLCHRRGPIPWKRQSGRLLEPLVLGDDDWL